MVHRRISDVGTVLRDRARSLPSDASRVWGRASALAADMRSRAAQAIGERSAGRQPLDADNMTKDELMDLARKEDVSGRSSMTKAQLAAALRRLRRP